MNFPSCDLSSGCGGLSQRSDRLEPEPVLGLKSEYDFVFRIHLSFQSILFDYKEAKRIIMMHNGLTAWELSDLLTCHCRSWRCITCHISVLHNSPLDSLITHPLSLNVGHNPCIYNLYSQPRSQSRVIMSLRKFPRDPAPVSAWHWNIVYGTKIYFNHRQHSTFMLAAREMEGHTF